MVLCKLREEQFFYPRGIEEDSLAGIMQKMSFAWDLWRLNKMKDCALCADYEESGRIYWEVPLVWMAADTREEFERVGAWFCARCLYYLAAPRGTYKSGQRWEAIE